MLSWEQIDTVLLDMDGTLLDLHFDNYFWREHLPLKWGEKHDIELDEARNQLTPRFEKIFGTMSWYCVDYWSEELQLDIMELKNDVHHLINVRPHTETFLQFLKESDKHVVMVTNSHVKVLDMKMQKTGIDRYFDRIYSSHSLGVIKEDRKFWETLNREFEFDPARTVLIDDNVTVLRTAKRFGIRHLLSIAQPDSKSARHDTGEFMAISSFEHLIT